MLLNVLKNFNHNNLKFCCTWKFNHINHKVLNVLERSITSITKFLTYLKNQSHQSRTFEKQSQQSYQSQNFRHTWSFQSRKYNCRKYSRKSIIHNHWTTSILYLTFFAWGCFFDAKPGNSLVYSKDATFWVLALRLLYTIT